MQSSTPGFEGQNDKMPLKLQPTISLEKLETFESDNTLSSLIITPKQNWMHMRKGQTFFTTTKKKNGGTTAKHTLGQGALATTTTAT